MSYPESQTSEIEWQRQGELLASDNQGAGRSSTASLQTALGDQSVPELTNAELVQLQIRVIALENLVVALLADSPDAQLDKVRQIGVSILPRPGVQHRLTVHATAQMEHLTRRAMRL